MSRRRAQRPWDPPAGGPTIAQLIFGLRVGQLLTIIGFLGGTFGLGYQLGSKVAQLEMHEHLAEVRESKRQIEEVRRTNEKSLEAAHAARNEAENRAYVFEKRREYLCRTADEQGASIDWARGVVHDLCSANADLRY